METRRKLVRAARQLFVSKGYDETTLEEIADAAGLHVQTLYRHFGTKQELARAGDIYWLNLFEDERAFGRVKVSHSTPTILGASLEIRGRYETLLTENLAKDFQMDPEGVSTPRLVACMLMAGNAYVRAVYADHDTDLKTDTLKVIDTVTEMFRHLVKTPAIVD